MTTHCHMTTLHMKVTRYLQYTRASLIVRPCRDCAPPLLLPYGLSTRQDVSIPFVYLQSIHQKDERMIVILDTVKEEGNVGVTGRQLWVALSKD